MRKGENKKVVVGLSGGVDSSVSAFLLKQQGFDVIGVYLKTWEDDDPQCPSERDAADARAVAAQLGIPFYVFNAKEDYKKDVFKEFIAQHERHRTPNVDLLCNRYVKFGVLWNIARELGAEFLSTGHYASIKDGKLCIPKDQNKDQTYFLAFTKKESLKNVIFPLGQYEKSEIRAIAKRENLVTADKKDSVGICMIGDRDYADFVKKYVKPAKGDIIEHESQKVVGKHDGITFYTLGQRKNLGIGGVKGAAEAPWFVIGKDIAQNQVVVSQNEDLLLKKELIAINPNWLFSEPQVGEKFTCKAKVRYRTAGSPCEVEILDEKKLKVIFESPEKAPTPGQAVVFYDGEVCLGGAEIDQVPEMGEVSFD